MSLRRRKLRKRKFAIVAPLSDRFRQMRLDILLNRSAKGEDESGLAAVNSHRRNWAPRVRSAERMRVSLQPLGLFC